MLPPAGPCDASSALLAKQSSAKLQALTLSGCRFLALPQDSTAPIWTRRCNALAYIICRYKASVRCSQTISTCGDSSDRLESLPLRLALRSGAHHIARKRQKALVYAALPHLNGCCQGKSDAVSRTELYAPLLKIQAASRLHPETASSCAQLQS